MPDASNSPMNMIGLALSGGGFRATLYHCGALIRLNELGYLPKLDRITSVSGGSIISARLAARWNALEFDANSVATNLDHEVIQPLRKFCGQTLDVRVIAGGFIPFTKSGIERLIEAYDEQLLDGMTLDQLPQKPDFIFKATNLQTGRLFRFARYHLADYLVGEIKDTSKFKVAQAVAASSAFPPILSPVKLKVKQSDWGDMDGTEFFGQSNYMQTINLTDGGVYDNLGLERIDKFGTILCSDAGKPFNFGSVFSALSPKQIMRALDIAMDQARGQRMSALFDLQKHTSQKIGHWDIDLEETKHPAPDLLPRPSGVGKRMAQIRTRLNKFTPTEQGQLINWGYVCCDERMRSYVAKDALPPTGLPVPDFPLA